MRLVLALAFMGLIAAACGGSASSTQSITGDDLLTKIDIPTDWDLYSAADQARDRDARR